MAAESKVDLTDPLAIVTSREIEAPRELVFEVWTDPKHLAQWWGPDGFTTTISAFDMRPGGVWRFVMHGPDGRDYDNRIVFDTIEPPKRIVYHHSSGEDPETVLFRSVVTFEDLGRSRTRVTLRATLPSAAERDRLVREFGADKGAAQTIARMAAYVAARAG